MTWVRERDRHEMRLHGCEAFILDDDPLRAHCADGGGWCETLHLDEDGILTPGLSPEQARMFLPDKMVDAVIAALRAAAAMQDGERAEWDKFAQVWVRVMPDGTRMVRIL